MRATGSATPGNSVDRLRARLVGGGPLRLAGGAVRAAWMVTLALARALASRAVLFQCPASFTPTPEHLRDFTAVFETMERDGLPLVWEPGEAWTAVTEWRPNLLSDTRGPVFRRVE